MITYQVIEIGIKDIKLCGTMHSLQTEDSVAHTVKLYMMDELDKPQKQIKNKDMSFRESNSL